MIQFLISGEQGFTVYNKLRWKPLMKSLCSLG
jgi:hypothetical protein